MNIKKPTLSRLLAWVLSLCLVSGLLPISVLAAELENVDTLSNENLQVLVDRRSGSFSIRTLEGDAIQKDDNNKNLLFPLGEDDTSFASLRVTRKGQTRDYVFGGKYAGSSDVAVTATSEEIRAVWSVDGITVTQTIRLANAGSNEHGMAYLSYTAENSGEAAQVQLRLLMDTALGTQDYGVYEVAQSGGSYERVTTERTITEYANNFFAYDDPQNPSVIAYFLNGSVGSTASKPAQMTLAHWNNLAATVFDYEADVTLDFTIPYNRDYMPSYGDLPKEQNAAFPGAKMWNPVTNEFTRKGCEVMPEMGYNEETDYLIYNWHVHPFTCSGLDQLLRVLGCTTVVFCGFAQNSVVYTSCLVAQDYWLNPIVPVDASYVCVQVQKEGWHENIDEVVTEAVIRVMLQDVARATTTDALIEKVKNFKDPGMPDHRTFYYDAPEKVNQF